MATATAPNGARFRVEIVPPGEPTRHRAAFAIFATFMMWWPHSGAVANRDWVVMIMRQRGAFRGFDIVAEKRFPGYLSAAQYMEAVRLAVTERGQIPSAPGPGIADRSDGR